MTSAFQADCGNEQKSLAPASWRSRLLLIARLLVVTAIYFAIFRTVDVTSMWSALGVEVALAFGLGVLLVLLQTILCTARWRLLIDRQPTLPPFVLSFWAYLESSFVNQALPSTAGGDALRVMRSRSAGLTGSVAFASVLLDRLSGATGAAILGGIASLLLSYYDVPMYVTLSILGLTLVVVGANVAFVFLTRTSRMLSILSALGRIYEYGERIRQSLVMNFRYTLSLGFSIVGHCLSGLAVYVFAQSLALHVDPFLCISVTSVVLLVSMIPISVAGWGLREVGFMTLLGPVGVSSHEAVLIGILFGLVCLASSLPGGLSLVLGWAKPAESR